jgi:hypothetical protein
VKKMGSKVLVQPVRRSPLTCLEEKLLRALKEVDTVGFAAQKVGITTKTAYNVFYRLRKKYVKARRFVNYVDAQKRKHDRLAMVLTDRMTETELQRDLEPKKEPEETQEEDN